MNKKLQVASSILAATLMASGVAVNAEPSPNASPNAWESFVNAEQGKGNSGQPSPKATQSGGNAGNPGKVSIAHCGCSSDGYSLEWKHLQVSSRAVGHLNHTEGTEVGCVDDIGVETLLTRGGSDCRISEEPANTISTFLECEIVPEAFSNCVQVIPEVEPVPE
jgi:hypothetical protein